MIAAIHSMQSVEIQNLQPGIVQTACRFEPTPYIVTQDHKKYVIKLRNNPSLAGLFPTAYATNYGTVAIWRRGGKDCVTITPTKTAKHVWVKFDAVQVLHPRNSNHHTGTATGIAAGQG